MKFAGRAGCLLAVALLFFGCKKPDGTAAAASPLGEDGPTNAQPKLPGTKLWLGAQELSAELAHTPLQVQTGMMFRTNMAETEGMLFVFSVPHRASFWMRNTLIPLSCAYIGSDGTILEIHDMKPKDETPIEAGTDKIQYVLEVNRGWFDRNKVSTGMVVRTERGSLRESFFGRR